MDSPVYKLLPVITLWTFFKQKGDLIYIEHQQKAFGNNVSET